MAPSIPGQETHGTVLRRLESSPHWKVRGTMQLGLVAWPVMSATWRLRQEDWLRARLETLWRETLCQNKTKGSAGLDPGECRKMIWSSRPTFTLQGEGWPPLNKSKKRRAAEVSTELTLQWWDTDLAGMRPCGQSLGTRKG